MKASETAALQRRSEGTSFGQRYRDVSPADSRPPFLFFKNHEGISPRMSLSQVGGRFTEAVLRKTASRRWTINCTKFFARIAAALLCLGVSLAFAAPHPLNWPTSLALDSKGNLYVSNNLGNQILVYNPSGQQLTAKTITANIHSPQQLTFDAQGNLWVVNVSSADTAFQPYISEYAPNGQQINTAYTANSSHFAIFPSTFTVDSVGDLWMNGVDAQGLDVLQVQNGPSVYNSDGVIHTHSELYGFFTVLAAHGPWIAMGSNFSVSWEMLGPLL
jgi:hypothetical protein